MQKSKKRKKREIKITDENDKKLNSEELAEKDATAEDDIQESVNDEQKESEDQESSKDETELEEEDVTEDIKEENNNKHLDQLQRLQAEFSNYKKRIDKERIELSGIFKREIISALLPAIDDFEHMLSQTHTEDAEFLKGVKLIHQKLIDVLNKQGLVPIESVGKQFDPKFHEAISVQTRDDGEDDVILEEWRKGYIFNEKLLRPTQVIVSKVNSTLSD